MAKKAWVQNYEPHPIIKKRFKNNRFFNLPPDRVKNYEPDPLILAFHLVYESIAGGILIVITIWILL
jgi:hypothetical protein